jgi:hypothetical protein
MNRVRVAWRHRKKQEAAQQRCKFHRVKGQIWTRQAAWQGDICCDRGAEEAAFSGVERAAEMRGAREGKNNGSQ